MVALHRDARARDRDAPPMSDCCARTLVQHLAFDPELQDRVWYSSRSARRNPALRCSGYSNGGTCDLPNLLDRLGFDPVAQTISWQRSKEPPGRKDLQLAPSTSATDRLFAHKNLLLPGRARKAYTPCASFLRSHPNVNRARMVTELAGALQYLHANRVVHGSIRPEAIFVDEDGVPLLAYTPLMVGQFVVLVDAYTAPELHQDEDAAMPTTASDVFSLGGIIHWICMGEHPPVSLCPTASENIQPLTKTGSPSTARNSVSANYSISQGYSPNPNLNSDSQHPSLQEDPSFHSLIEKARSHSPSHRPNLLSIVLQLQQTVARYFLCLSNLPLPAPASLSASLSLYLPRTPVKTPSPIAPVEDFSERFTCPSGIPSPSRPTEPPYPLHFRTTKADFIDTRSARACRSTQASNHGPGPVSGRPNRSPLLASLAPNRFASTDDGRTGVGSSAVGTHYWTSPPVTLEYSA